MLEPGYLHVWVVLLLPVLHRRSVHGDQLQLFRRRGRVRGQGLSIYSWVSVRMTLSPPFSFHPEGGLWVLLHRDSLLLVADRLPVADARECPDGDRGELYVQRPRPLFGLAHVRVHVRGGVAVSVIAIEHGCADRKCRLIHILVSLTRHCILLQFLGLLVLGAATARSVSAHGVVRGSTRRAIRTRRTRMGFVTNFSCVLSICAGLYRRHLRRFLSPSLSLLFPRLYAQHQQPFPPPLHHQPPPH